MDSNVTDKSDRHSELNSLREENRRLYQLVERLIATQESEQQHRKSIEAGLEELKDSLEERANAPDPVISEPRESPVEREDAIREQFERLGGALERQLHERMAQDLTALESRLAALIEAQAEKTAAPAGPADPGGVETALETMISPLGQDLKRAFELVEGLERALESRLADAGETVAGLSARQEEMQNETLAQVRDLVVSHSGRLTSEWAMQIGSLKRSIDDLRLELVSYLGRETERLESETAESAQNVVTGDFQRKAAEEGLHRAGEVPDPQAGPSETDSGFGSRPGSRPGSRQGPADEDDDEGDGDPEDALLTKPSEWAKPSEWGEEAEAEEEPVTLSGVARSGQRQPDKPLQRGPDRSGRSSADKSPASVGNAQGREPQAGRGKTDGKIDLRAYKDLRLSCEPGDAEERQPEAAAAEPAKPKDAKSYENAPAEASLTRFVRLIRARKRSTPS